MRIASPWRPAALAATLLAIAAVAPAAAHEGNPHYRSEVRTLTPAVDGLAVRVLDHDDALELTNRSTEVVVVYGHDADPFVRVLPDGTVQVNKHSPPRWVTLDKTGRYAWHDDRIKWRKTAVAPQVTDTAKETKVFDWQVPIRVGTQAGTIAGTLFWVGEPGSSSGFPVPAIVSLVVLALAAAGAVVLVRRRRQGAAR